MGQFAKALRDIQGQECAAPFIIMTCGPEICGDIGLKGSSSLTPCLAPGLGPLGLSEVTDRGVPEGDTGAPLVGQVEPKIHP